MDELQLADQILEAFKKEDAESLHTLCQKVPEGFTVCVFRTLGHGPCVAIMPEEDAERLKHSGPGGHAFRLVQDGPPGWSSTKRAPSQRVQGQVAPSTRHSGGGQMRDEDEVLMQDLLKEVEGMTDEELERAAAEQLAKSRERKTYYRAGASQREREKTKRDTIRAGREKLKELGLEVKPDGSVGPKGG